MKLTKTKTKTILTITMSFDELKRSLELYQTDQIAELAMEYFQDPEEDPIVPKDVAKFSLICMAQGPEFQLLVDKTGIQWIPTPTLHSSWLNIFCDCPYIFGITDSVVTEDVNEIFLILDNEKYNVTKLINNI